MKKIILFLLLILALLTSCTGSARPEETGGVIVATGSFAQVWLLAGGELLGTTSDAFDNGFVAEGEAENIGGLHEPNLEYIFALSPGLVILSSDIPAHIALGEALSTAGIETAFYSVQTFEDYLAQLRSFAEITGRGDLYELYGERIHTRINELTARAATLEQPTVLLVRAGAGRIVARGSDTMAGVMLADMNTINIAEAENSLLDELSMEIIIRKDPDFILATIMGDEENGLQLLEDLLESNPAWSGLSAVRNGHYVVLPRDLFHLKPNERWAESYEFLWDVLFGREQ